MTTSTSFTTPSFSVLSAQQVSYNIVRVTFNAKPLALSSTAANDALNVTNYVFTGPGTISVSKVTPTIGDVFSIDLVLNAPIILGSYSLAINNIVAG